MGESETKARVFFALWPSAALAQAMARHAREIERRVGGRVTRTDSIHLTLAFIGDIAESRLANLCDAASMCTTRAFELNLDHLGFWRHNGIGWLAPSVIPEPLADLQKRLREWLAAHGIKLDERAFTPHVTLLRRGAGCMQGIDIEPIVWPVSTYELVRSNLDQPSARYHVIKRYALIT